MTWNMYKGRNYRHDEGRGNEREQQNTAEVGEREGGCLKCGEDHEKSALERSKAAIE